MHVCSWLPVCLLLVASSALAQPQPPELTRPVNDFASVIDADSARQMESLIRSLQETTGDVVVVATIDSLEGEDVNQYAVKMFENRGRGIGQKGKDNGLLVLIAVKDRSVKIEVGYDLEQFITDGFAGETIREEMAPQFRRGAYGAGLAAAVTRIIGRIAEGRNVSISGAPPVRASRAEGHRLRSKLHRCHRHHLHPDQCDRRSPSQTGAATLGRRVWRLAQRRGAIRRWVWWIRPWWRIRRRIWRIRRRRRGRLRWIRRRPQRRRRCWRILVGLVVSG